jgi:hypothetical protein
MTAVGGPLSAFCGGRFGSLPLPTIFISGSTERAILTSSAIFGLAPKHSIQRRHEMGQASNLRKRPGRASRSPVGHRLYAESEDAGCKVGAAGSGAPFGRRNGNYRHGYFTAEAKEQRLQLRLLIRGD